MWSPDAPRSFLTWSLGFGIQRRMMLREAKRGDLISRLTTDDAITADPFATYDTLRAGGTVVRNRLVGATAHHAAANQVLRSEDFGVAGGHAELPPPLRRLLDRIADPGALGPVDPPSMLVVDPPDHTRYRKLVARSFTARRVGCMRGRVDETANRLLDGIDRQAGGSFDLVEQYAAQLPVAVIADLLGVPERGPRTAARVGQPGGDHPRPRPDLPGVPRRRGRPAEHAPLVPRPPRPPAP